MEHIIFPRNKWVPFPGSLESFESLDVHLLDLLFRVHHDRACSMPYEWGWVCLTPLRTEIYAHPQGHDHLCISFPRTFPTQSTCVSAVTVLFDDWLRKKCTMRETKCWQHTLASAWSCQRWKEPTETFAKIATTANVRNEAVKITMCVDLRRFLFVENIALF